MLFLKSVKIGGATKSIYLYMFSLLTFFTVIIPNSFQSVSILVYFICACFSIYYIAGKGVSKAFLFLMSLSAVVTLIYLFVGVTNAAPVDAVFQIAFIYIISPFLWFLVLTALILQIGEEKILKSLVLVSSLCCLSSFLFFYLFLNYGAEAVSIFKENANINSKDGYSGATMHVYGSLIFLVGGFFAAPEVVKNKVIMIIFLGMLAFTSISSGRSALILSILIGLFVFIFFTSSQSTSLKSKLGILLSLILSAIFVFYIAITISGIDISLVFSVVYEKILSGGGGERTIQTSYLLDSFNASNALGVGHGVGVDYIRSERFPWRYETIWVATLHRVGIIGALVYVLPFVIYVVCTIYKSISKSISVNEKFFFGAFLSAFAASNTNPYLEGFTFQWMYILPVLAFFMRERSM